MFVKAGIMSMGCRHSARIHCTSSRSTAAGKVPEVWLAFGCPSSTYEDLRTQTLHQTTARRFGRPQGFGHVSVADL